jgi:hypothetical protein
MYVHHFVSVFGVGGFYSPPGIPAKYNYQSDVHHPTLVKVSFMKLSFLKVPKHEIFDGGFFASKEPICSPDS